VAEGFGASVDAEFWVETQDWPVLARYVYIYSWTNSHVSGVLGVGRVGVAVMRTECSLDARQWRAATDFLLSHDKLRFYPDDWLWVVNRAERTLLTRDNVPNRNMVLNAAKVLSRRGLPAELIEAFNERYGGIFDALKMARPKPRIWSEKA